MFDKSASCFLIFLECCVKQRLLTAWHSIKQRVINASVDKWRARLKAWVRWVDGICGSGQSGTVKNGGVENTGVDISARCGKGGQCRSGQFSTMLQGWTLQEWTNQHDMASVDIAGVDNAAPCGRGGQCRSGIIGLAEPSHPETLHFKYFVLPSVLTLLYK